MSALVVGLLHPGDMGSRVGACLRTAGHEVLWARSGRSADTVARAEDAGLRAVDGVDELFGASDVVLSVVPPHAALDVARQAAGRVRLFVDANAVSPATAAEVAGVVEAGGGAFVDGAIIGPPPRQAGTTRLYLSGERADEVSSLFAGSVLEAPVVTGPVGAASSLKMTYAAWTKGTDALLLAIVATARHHGVDADLLQEWGRSRPELLERLHGAGWAAGRKGWRWVNEMEQIAATFADAGLPPQFHEAAAEVFRRAPHDPSAERDDASVSAVVAGLLSSAPVRT
jgi:3-hydroxyisobutyrate dehydrogenase-like beta-hydroxyacid dehydrogenase